MSIQKSLEPFFKEIAKLQKDELLDNLSPSAITRLNSLLEKCLKRLEKEEEKKSISHVASSLKKSYRIYTQKGYTKSHQNIVGWNFKTLKPSLQKELKKRIFYSLELIKDGATKQKGAVMARFLNWTNSRAQGQKTSIKSALSVGKELRKGKKHLRFVLGDQTRKMLGNFDRAVAEKHQAIAFIWKTRRDDRVVGNPSGKYPKVTNPKMHGNHYKRLGKLYFLHGSWAIKEGKIKTKTKGFEWADFEDGWPGQPIGCRCFAYYLYRLKDIPPKFLNLSPEEKNFV